MEKFGKYFGDLHVAIERGPLTSAALLIAWLLFPVAVQTVLHPVDAIGFEYWSQHQPIPRFYTPSMVSAGAITATMVFIALSLFALGATVLFYRHATYFVKLWPAAALLAAVIGNGVWWIDKGFWSTTGAAAGVTPMVLMGISQAICESLGADFVFGKGVRPRRA